MNVNTPKAAVIIKSTTRTTRPGNDVPGLLPWRPRAAFCAPSLIFATGFGTSLATGFATGLAVVFFTFFYWHFLLYSLNPSENYKRTAL